MIERCCAFTGHRPKKFPWGYNEADARCVGGCRIYGLPIWHGGGGRHLGGVGGSGLEKRKSRAETPLYPAL